MIVSDDRPGVWFICGKQGGGPNVERLQPIRPDGVDKTSLKTNKSCCRNRAISLLKGGANGLALAKERENAVMGMLMDKKRTNKCIAG